MSTHFSRSLRRLEADGSRRSLLALLTTLTFLALWFIWFMTARVAVYATSGNARLEVDRENHPVDAPVAGQVVVAPLSAGRAVKAGDVLLELDARSERLARTEALARVDPAARQIQSVNDELTAQRRALDQERRSAQAAAEESASRARESRTASEYATEEARRLATLQRNGLVSEMESLRASKVADQRRSEAQTAEFSAGRLARDLDARQQDRLARIARLQNERAAIEGARGEAFASSNRFGYEIEQRLVRAPISGTIAEASALKIGSMVKLGDRICTIVPDGMLKVVALFSPSVALGRVHQGQPGRVRLEGFPWTQYGSTTASVSHVAGELRDGTIRVELVLQASPGSAVPLQHGLPAEVDVEVEQSSPLELVLRSAGNMLRVNAAEVRLDPLRQ